MTNKTCPLCYKKLSLKQINFNLAVLICEDLKCKYPVGYDCVVVERKFEDMDKDVEVLDRNNEDLEDWLDEIVDITNDDTRNEDVSPPSVPNLCSTDEVNHNSIEWINDMVEEAVNDAKCQSSEGVNETVGPALDTDFDDILNFVYNIG